MTRLSAVLATAALATGAAVAYGKVVRPALARWGATDQEVGGPYPGADQVPGGERAMTMAVTIAATPSEVWPWLVQLGGDRAGWYSWDRLDNGGVPSARAVHPEWQNRAIGDRLKMRLTSKRTMDSYTVAILEPQRFLGLHGLTDLRGGALRSDQPRPGAFMEGLWGFQLTELAGGHTRLVVGGYQIMRPRWLERVYDYWLYVPLVWIMQARMLAVLKRNIEHASKNRQDDAQRVGGASLRGPGTEALEPRSSNPAS